MLASKFTVNISPFPFVQSILPAIDSVKMFLIYFWGGDGDRTVNSNTEIQCGVLEFGVIYLLLAVEI